MQSSVIVSISSPLYLKKLNILRYILHFCLLQIFLKIIKNFKLFSYLLDRYRFQFLSVASFFRIRNSFLLFFIIIF